MARFILPGPETINISGQTVDKLLRAGDGDAALLYLYILKTRGQSTSEEAAAALGLGAGGVATAMAALSRLGLIGFDDNKEPLPSPPKEEPREYSADEIKREIESGSDFSALVEEAQRSLGKILSPDELTRLFGIYDGLRLPPEVILQLITHCIAESRKKSGGRPPTMRYVEKAAYTWEREGIFSLDRAEEYLKALDKRRSKRGTIKTALQIRDRELSASEKRYVDGWIEMGFGADAVEIAYDRTLLKTGKLAWGYIDSIIRSWHSKGLRTPDDILQRDSKSGPKPQQGHGQKQQQGQKFGAPDTAELERMQRLLKKLKEEE